jgi:SAM-dependent methyltransferase
MDLKRLKANWELFARTDPLYAILTFEGKQNNQWDTQEFFSLGKAEIERLLESIKSLGLDLQRKRALDFGCGVGRLTQALAVHFDVVCGIDIAPTMIKLARQYNRYGDKCEFYINCAGDLSILSSNTFDLIYSSLALQHIDPRYSIGFIREFLRVLSPRGLLVFQLPQAPLDSVQKKTKRSLRSLMPLPLRRLYHTLRYGGSKPLMEMHGISKPEVLRVLEDSGGEILSLTEDAMAEHGWVSITYYATKRRPAKTQRE